MAMVDGEFQAFKASDGAAARKVLFGSSPELEQLVSDLSDEDIANLQYGGHDRQKVYAAYLQATQTDNGRPTVIRAEVPATAT